MGNEVSDPRQRRTDSADKDSADKDSADQRRKDSAKTGEAGAEWAADTGVTQVPAQEAGTSRSGVTAERNNRLYWRSRRGMTEVEFLLLPFFEQRFPSLPAPLQDSYERLLGCEDPELWEWLQGRSEPQEPDFKDLIQRIRAVQAS